MDLLHGMSKSALKMLPLPDSLKSQGLDIEFHWVSESGKPSHLTAGGSIETIVSIRTKVPGLHYP